MGTLLRIFCEGYTSTAVDAVIDAMFASIQRFEESLSRFRSESELSRINRGELPEEHASALVRTSLAAARRYERETHGAFDPKGDGGWDLGGLAKGLSLDHALGLAMAFPEVESVRVDFGGQLVFWNRSGKVNEEVRVEFPESLHRGTVRIRIRRCGSLSTSAPFERGPHIRNPRTGEPLSIQRSVTVLAASAADADAWSTALFVRGPEQGRRLLTGKPAVQAYFVESSGVASGQTKNAKTMILCGS